MLLLSVIYGFIEARPLRETRAVVSIVLAILVGLRGGSRSVAAG